MDAKVEELKSKLHRGQKSESTDADAAQVAAEDGADALPIGDGGASGQSARPQVGAAAHAGHEGRIRT